MAKWLVRIELDDGETVERVVFGQRAGDAARVAVAALVTSTGDRDAWAHRLGGFRVIVRGPA